MDEPGTTSNGALSEIEIDIVKECSRCPDLILYPHDNIIGHSYQSFHKPCLKPPCSQYEALESVLCNSCRHLRFWHLIICKQSEHPEGFGVILDSALKLEKFKAKKCPLCKVIGNILLQYGPGVSRLVKLSGLVRRSRIITRPDLSIHASDLREDHSITLTIMGHDSFEMGATIVGTLQIMTDTCRPKPLVGELVSWSRVRKMMQVCFEEHPQCKHHDSPHLPEGFRVIDVAKRCLTENSGGRFVALSYVWGADVSQSLAACEHNIEKLWVAGSLSADRLPRTIEDAMRVCEQLQERYLWVDRLCIIQDDTEDKARQIRAMGEIYSAARFVIVAAYGDGMDFGIPGVSRARQVTQITSNLPGMTATNHVIDKAMDPMAVWPTRAWTYQEVVLARRTLYFTNTRAFLECEQGFSHEDEFNTSTKQGRKSSAQLRHVDDASDFESYTDHVETYSTMLLSFPSDKYAAFSGILDSLFGLDLLHYGLPLAFFDRALHWSLESDEHKASIGLHNGSEFPSWSWFSQHSPPDPIEHCIYGFCGALTAWYKYDIASNTMLALNQQCDSGLRSDWRLYMAIAYEQGCVMRDVGISLGQKTGSDVRFSTDNYWPDYPTFYQQLGRLVNKISPGSILQEAPSAILGHVQTTSFSLQVGDYDTVKINNLQGTSVGALHGRFPQFIKDVEFEHVSDFWGVRHFEFVATMLSFLLSPDFVTKGEWKDKHYVVDGQMTKEVPVVNVMLITWDGHVARRKALGWVYLKDWAAARREEKTIILQ